MESGYLRPKRLIWAKWTTIIAAVSVVTFAAWNWWSPWRPGRAGGLVFGTIAALIFLFEAIYPVRRRLMAAPLRTAQDWLQLHVYCGVLACLFVWMHVGFRLPTGTLGWLLLTLTMWATVTGVVGVFLQKRLPAMLAGNLTVEAIFERIPEMVARLPAQADEVVRDASDVLRNAYVSEVRGVLVAGPPPLSQLLDLPQYRERRLQPLQRVQAFVPEADRDRLASLEALVTERVELDAHRALQRVMRSWLIVHVPPAIVLMGLLAAHLVAVWLY